MITLQRIGTGYYNPNRKEFLIDSASDISGLPTSKKEGTNINGTCAPGSMAYTPDLASAWMLGNDDVWHKIPLEGNGAS